MNPFLATDGYKVSHMPMYPDGTVTVYDNFTPRSNKHAPKGCDKVVIFGQQMVMRQIKEMFDKDFFKNSLGRKGLENLIKIKEEEGDIEGVKRQKEILKNLKEQICGEIKKEYSMYLGTDYDVSHIEALWDLGYLPIKVKALPEGLV